jgi:hypothetical protein
MPNLEREMYMKPWFEEQPTLSEYMVAAETRLKEAETLYLQELDRVCALSSPRVAFERRLDYMARIRRWRLCCGTICGEPCYIESWDPKDEGLKKYTVQMNDSNNAERVDMDFLSKDHGNFVSYGEWDKNDLFMFLYVLPDPESMTVGKLKDELTRRELSVSGERADLVARLLSEAVNPVRKRSFRLY